MIFWLASYPKSGNTLLRSILSTYFFSEDGEFKFEHLYKIGQFPNTDHFLRIGINPTNEKKIFENYINAHHFIQKEVCRVSRFNVDIAISEKVQSALLI